MTLKLTSFILLATLICLTISQTTKPSVSKSSSEEDDIADAIQDLIKTCKTKGCKKEDILKEIGTTVDNLMKEVKPGELSRDETLKDIDILAKALGENEPIKGSEVKEFLLGLMKKFEDKFGNGGATTKKM